MAKSNDKTHQTNGPLKDMIADLFNATKLNPFYVMIRMTMVNILTGTLIG